MKKLLAYGLVLSTLIPFGSMCFATGPDESPLSAFDYADSQSYSVVVEDNWYDINQRQDGDLTGGARPPHADKQEILAKKYENKKQLQSLRDHAIALLSGYYEDGFGVTSYTVTEISEMRLGDLNEDCTILTAAGVIKQLPQIVSETLRGYLALRAALPPKTIGAENPLFIHVFRDKEQAEVDFLSSSNIFRLAKKGRKQLETTRSGLIFLDSKEIKMPITELRNKAIFDLFDYCLEQGWTGLEVSELLSNMKINDIDLDGKNLRVLGAIIDCPQHILDSLCDYVKVREDLFPETMGNDCPLFIECLNPKKASTLMPDGVQGIYSIYRRKLTRSCLTDKV